MNTIRYRTILYLQYLFLLVDLTINAFSELMRLQNVTLLIVYVIQDICGIFAVIVMFLMFFNTYVLQAGLVVILVRKFKVTVMMTFAYLTLTIALHVWTLILRWHNTDVYIWEKTEYRVLYTVQRLGAVLYYYLYKRTALRLADGRFYEDSAWMREQFALHAR